jgi:hypothetical protein
MFDCSQAFFQDFQLGVETEWLEVQAKLGPHWGSVFEGVLSLLGLNPPIVGVW